MANLSNINGKFLFTDGDFLLIDGATANSISTTESGIAIKNSNAATLSLQNSATNGKNHTLWSNTDGSFNITDIGVATRFTIASGGDVYFPESLRVGIGTTSIYPQGADTILKIFSPGETTARLYLQNGNTGSNTTDGSQIYASGLDLNISNADGPTKFWNNGSLMMYIQKFDGSANSNPLISSNITLFTGSKTGWLPGDILSKIEFYSNDVSGIGARNAASIRCVNETGNGSTTTTFSGGLAFYTSALNSTEQEAMRIGSSGSVSVLKTDSSTYSSTTPVADLILSRKNTENTNNETVGIRFDVTGWSGSTTGGAAIEAIQPSNASSANLAFLTRNAGTWGERMRITSGGNVGIGSGMTNPEHSLVVNGNIGFGDGTYNGGVYSRNTSTDGGVDENWGLEVQRTASTDDFNVRLTFYPFAGSTRKLGFWNAQTDSWMGYFDGSTNSNNNFIINGGNVGIGTTSPRNDTNFITLQVGNTTTAASQIVLDDNDSNGPWRIISNQSLIINDDATERMRIDSNGYVTIKNNAGVDSASLTFSNSDIGIGINQSIGYLNFYSNDSSTSSLGGVGGIAVKSEEAFNTSYTPTYMSFYTHARTANNGTSLGNVTERMRITSAGNIQVSSHTGSTIGYGLQISPQGGYAQIYMEADTTSSRLIQRYYNPNGNVGNITISGSTTSYGISSDYRLKENVVEMTGALDRISQLKPSRFNFIADADTTVDGFLAHEVQEIVPEAITGEKDAVDEEGNPEYQGIDQSKLVPLLVGAMQEQQKIINDLKNRIETLENK